MEFYNNLKSGKSWSETVRLWGALYMWRYLTIMGLLMPLWGCDFYVIVGKSIFQNAIPWALTFLFERMPFIIKVLCNSPHKGIICFDIET